MYLNFTYCFKMSSVMCRCGMEHLNCNDIFVIEESLTMSKALCVGQDVT